MIYDKTIEELAEELESLAEVNRPSSMSSLLHEAADRLRKLMRKQNDVTEEEQ